MTKWAVLALAAVFLAAPAMAQDTNETVGEVTGTGDDAGGLLDAVGEAVEGAGEAVDKTGQGIADGASAVGQGVTAAVQFIGRLAVDSVTAVAQSGAAVSGAVAAAAVALGTTLAWVGAALTGAVGTAGDGLAWLGLGAWSGLLGYFDLVGRLRPDAMPVTAFAAVTSAGAAGSAGAGGWAGFQALKKWGWLGSGIGGVAGFSRINDDELLEHPLRGDIFTTIKDHPGIHASKLARELDVGWGTITHHLDKLQRAKLVTTRRVNNQKCFFENGGTVSRQDMAIASALKGDTASSIAMFVQHHPMTSQKAMAEDLGISPALASFHVKKLTNLGVLEKVRHGKETLLTTSDGMRRVMESDDPYVAAAIQKAEAGFEYSS